MFASSTGNCSTTWRLIGLMNTQYAGLIMLRGRNAGNDNVPGFSHGDSTRAEFLVCAGRLNRYGIGQCAGSHRDHSEPRWVTVAGDN